ncbi:putative methylase [Methanolobus psychrophilus R15]|nr:putative methylase [Methanolobus psychrophilus R15]
MASISYRNATIKLDENSYDPAEDSFLLADAAVEHTKDDSRVLEIGTGTGFVSAVLRANRDVNLVATEINPHAASCARSNGIEVIRTDMFAGLRKGNTFDIIIFNPPYLPTSENEKVPGWLNYAFDGGIDGRDAIGSFLNEAFSYLAPGGTVMLLISSLTGIDEVRKKMEGQGFQTEIVASARCSFEELVVVKASMHNLHEKYKN